MVSRLVQGVVGEFYLGYEKILVSWVAGKVLPAQFGRDRELIRRFHAEATSAAKLLHPNIIQIYFIGEDAGHHFFAMQYVEGTSLAGLFSPGGKASVREALVVLLKGPFGLA